MNTSDRPLIAPFAMPPLVRILFVCEALLALAYAVDQWAGHPSFELAHLIDLDGERNIPTWFSSMQLLILGLLLAASAGPVSSWRQRRHWPVLALAVLAIVFSCEEVAGVHEWISHRANVLLPGGTRSGTIVRQTGIWMFLLVPPFVVLVFALWRGFRRAPSIPLAVARRYQWGFALYVAAISGIELLANSVPFGSSLAATEVLFEELTEMAAVTVLVWASLDLLAARNIRLALFPPSRDDLRRTA